MILLSKPAKVLEQNASRTVFEVEGLYPGYGVTIGNSIRRVLLSSLEGAAITQVKIKGASHEFSTLPGVMEDTIALLLNLKLMRFRLLGEESQRATLKIKGEKEVKGSDFEFPSQVELINKDIHIATLTSKSGELEMEIQIEKGIGYVQAKDLSTGKKEIGLMPLDAMFTPVKKVSYSVQHMRVGERTDFDKLTMEVETDGTISPQEAFLEALNILTKQFEIIGQGLKIQQAEELTKKEAHTKESGKKEAKKAKASGKTSKKKAKK